MKTLCRIAGEEKKNMRFNRAVSKYWMVDGYEWKKSNTMSWFPTEEAEWMVASVTKFRSLRKSKTSFGRTEYEVPARQPSGYASLVVKCINWELSTNVWTWDKFIADKVNPETIDCPRIVCEIRKTYLFLRNAKTYGPGRRRGSHKEEQERISTNGEIHRSTIEEHSKN